MRKVIGISGIYSRKLDKEHKDVPISALFFSAVPVTMTLFTAPNYDSWLTLLWPTCCGMSRDAGSRSYLSSQTRIVIAEGMAANKGG